MRIQLLCCEKLRINEVLTHEQGCTEAWKDYKNTCTWCGFKFYPEVKGQRYCSEACYDCDCPKGD